MDYWTNGYFVLMQVIEAVLGDTIESIAHQRLFQPLGMRYTTFDSAKAESIGRVLPFAFKQERRLTELATAPPLGETGLWTTAPDLVRFGQALLHGDFFAGRLGMHATGSKHPRAFTYGWFLA